MLRPHAEWFNGQLFINSLYHIIYALGMLSSNDSINLDRGTTLALWASNCFAPVEGGTCCSRRDCILNLRAWRMPNV
jgi:hypothetical protein